MAAIDSSPPPTCKPDRPLNTCLWISPKKKQRFSKNRIAHLHSLRIWCARGYRSLTIITEARQTNRRQITQVRDEQKAKTYGEGARAELPGYGSATSTPVPVVNSIQLA